jgi:hypothetical protein
MSFQHGGQCFSTQVEAWASLAAEQAGSVYSAGSAIFVLDVDAVSASGIAYSLRDMLGSGTVNYVAAPVMQPCALLDFEDGLELGWMVGGIWIIAACILAVARARKGG